MAPPTRSSKRQKLSPADDGTSSTSSISATPPIASTLSTLPTASQSALASSSTPPLPSAPPQDAPNNRSSWYSRTWPKKAAPITQVARESISSASNSAIETASIIKDKVSNTALSTTSSRKSSLALTLGKSYSNKALPAVATPTKDHAMPDVKRTSKEHDSTQPPTDTDTDTDMDMTSPNQRQKEPTLSAGSQDTTRGVKSSNPLNAVAPGTVAGTAPQSWIGWLAGSEGLQKKPVESSPPKDQKIDAQPQTAKPPNILPNTATDSPHIPQPDLQQLSDDVHSTDPISTTPLDQTRKTAQRKSWLPIWSNAAASHSAPAITSPPPQDTTPVQQSDLEPSATTNRATSAQDHHKEQDPAKDPSAKSAAWVFWSRDKPADISSLKDAPREGEIAVANTDSETRPRRASLDTQPKSASPAQDVPPVVTIGKKAKDKKSISRDVVASDSDTAPKTTKVENKQASATAVAPSEVKSSRPASPAPVKKSYQHQLLPSLHDTLKVPETPSLIQKLAHLFYSTKDSDLKHLDLVRDPPRINNALAIGVHGYFPTPLIQSVLGRPTGTSFKFADMAASSIRRYTKSRGYTCSVKTAALEGEGRIAERIDLLWKLLLNWIEEIRKADFVMVACHSQGVPVAIMLVAKLIHFGCVNSARVGICAMAGVNMGPFPEFKSRWMSGSAGELFEFADPHSKVSTDYLAALEDVLKFGARLTYVGSIDDQLVSMESSMFAPISHPHIFRAVSIDSRLHAPNFVSNLVAFVLKLRNLGVQDHGLIRELSVPLAGSLYTGEGHSRLYEDDAIYDLAIAFALETTAMPSVSLSKRDIGVIGGNPYILPFAMRGLLEEDFVKSDLQHEASQLLKQFDEWKPITKALKDVKFRLEGIRSKL